MVDQALSSTNDLLDELLVKGEDGKFYVLRGETLVPVEESTGAEDDVSTFAATAAAVPVPPSPEQLIRGVLTNASIRVEDPVIRSRLEKALTLFFKDLRNRLETKEVLMRSPKIGGTGFTEEQVDSLLKNADAKRTEWLKAMSPVSQERPPVSPLVAPRPQKPAAPVLEKKMTPTPPVVGAPPPNLPIVAEEPKQAIVTEAARPALILKVPKPTPPPSLPPLPPTPATPVKAPAVIPKPEVSQPLVSTTSPQSSPQRRGRKDEVQEVLAPPKSATGGRPLIMDVIPPPPRAVGPVDELRYDLPTYRRLGSPNVASEKILEKMKVLFRSSWNDGMHGVTAWKESPVMRLVSEATQQSINKGIPVTTAIQDMLRAGKPMVTGEEWIACVELLGKIDAFIQGGK